METPITSTSIVDQIKEHLESRFALAKLQGIDKASVFVAEMMTGVIMITLTILTFILAIITLALFLAQILGSGWEGFGCVTVLYLLLLFVARLFKVSLQNLFIRLFIQKIFNKN